MAMFLLISAGCTLVVTVADTALAKTGRARASMLTALIVFPLFLAIMIGLFDITPGQVFILAGGWIFMSAVMSWVGKQKEKHLPPTDTPQK